MRLIDALLFIYSVSKIPFVKGAKMAYSMMKKNKVRAPSTAWGKSMLALDAISIADGVWGLATTKWEDMTPLNTGFDVLQIAVGVHMVKGHHVDYSDFDPIMKQASHVSEGFTKYVQTPMAHRFAGIWKSKEENVFVYAFQSSKSVYNKVKVRFHKDHFMIGDTRYELDPDVVSKVGYASLALSGVVVAAGVIAKHDFANSMDNATSTGQEEESVGEEMLSLVDKIMDFERNPYDTITALQHSGESSLGSRMIAFAHNEAARKQLKDYADLMLAATQGMAPGLDPMDRIRAGIKVFDMARAQKIVRENETLKQEFNPVNVEPTSKSHEDEKVSVNSGINGTMWQRLTDRSSFDSAS